MNPQEDMEQGGLWFLGRFEYAVDGQRRVAIPKPWRSTNDRAARFFLLPGRDRSIQVVPGLMFLDLLGKLRRVSFADAAASVALAKIGSMAQDCLCDGQGRVSLTPELMAHAGIAPKSKVLLLGAVTTIQIWSPAAWSKQSMDSSAGLDVIQALQERPDDLTAVLRTAFPGVTGGGSGRASG